MNPVYELLLWTPSYEPLNEPCLWTPVMNPLLWTPLMNPSYEPPLMNSLYDDTSHSPEDEPPLRSALQTLRRCASRQFGVVLGSWTMILYSLSLNFSLKSNWEELRIQFESKRMRNMPDLSLALHCPDLCGNRLKCHRRMCKGHSLQVNKPQAWNTWYIDRNLIFAYLLVQTLYGLFTYLICKPYLCISLDKACEVFQVGCWTRLWNSASMTWKRINCLHEEIIFFLSLKPGR